MASSGNISRRDLTSIMLWRLCTCVMVLAAVSMADVQMDTANGLNMSLNMSTRDAATGEDDQDVVRAQPETRDAGVALSSPGKYAIEYKGFNYAESSPANFPDMDYGLMGYDILKGFPLAIGHDPGFTLPIFLADYSGDLQTADGSWSLPKGVVAVPDVSCVTSFSSKVVKSSRALSKSMEASVGVSGGGWGVSFSASAGYQEASSEVSSGEYILIISKASCDYYYMQLKMYDLPPLDPSFLKWIIKLNNTNNDGDFIDFVETVKENPLPVHYELKSIENLFSAALSGPSGSLNNIDFHGIKKKIIANVKSNSDCIDLCHDLAKCEAVDYCEKCASADSDYHKCRAYMASEVDSGTKNSKWETTILMPDLKIPLVLKDNFCKFAGKREGRLGNDYDPS
nr:hypothetical protein BaRGS_031105 [Batillaria attramentaria]